MSAHFSVTCSSFFVTTSVSLKAIFTNYKWHDYEGGTTVGMLRVMSRRGDDRVSWDVQKVLTGDPEATAAVREAERIFAQERARGATAFRLDPGQSAQRIEQFDKTAEQIILVPRVVGG
jgi:hypothetical protein